MNIWMIWGSPVWRNLQMGYHMGYFRKFWDVLTEFVKKTTLKAWRFGDNKMFSDSKEIWRFFSQSFGASWYHPMNLNISKHCRFEGTAGSIGAGCFSNFNRAVNHQRVKLIVLGGMNEAIRHMEWTSADFQQAELLQYPLVIQSSYGKSPIHSYSP